MPCTPNIKLPPHLEAKVVIIKIAVVHNLAVKALSVLQAHRAGTAVNRDGDTGTTAQQDRRSLQATQRWQSLQTNEQSKQQTTRRVSGLPA